LNLLIDSHIAIWVVLNDPRLSPKGRALVADTQNSIFVSTASIWEIAIKHAARKGRGNAMPFSGHDAIAEFEAAGFELLPISPSQAAKIDDLPHIHGDPFDRMMVVQAQAELMRFVTHDAILADYGDFVELV
jgi:PIN domain nuclease of toxin-antitoxin system